MQSTSTLRNRAYSYIYLKLMRGELAPGDRLSNRKLAAEIGVSFIPVREAISELASAGLVEHRPGEGSFVATYSRQDILELYDLREALECHAVVSAAAEVEQDALAELREIHNDMRAIVAELERDEAPSLTPELADGWLTAEARFHLCIFRTAGNRRALKTLRDLRVVTRIFGRRSLNRPLNRLQGSCGEHAAILDALSAHDGEAARELIREHIRNGCKSALKAYDSQRMSEADDTSTALWDTLGEMEDHGT